MANQQKPAQRGRGWLGGATVATGSALPSYSGLYGGVDSLMGQNGYAGGGGTGQLSGAQFGGGSDAGAGMGGGGDAGGGVGGGGGNAT